jgi:histone H3/H4
LIPLAPFTRVVKQVVAETRGTYNDRTNEQIPLLRMQVTAIVALRQAAEDFLVQLFEDTVRCCVHRNRVTITPKDLALALRLTQNSRSMGGVITTLNAEFNNDGYRIKGL